MNLHLHDPWDTQYRMKILFVANESFRRLTFSQTLEKLSQWRLAKVFEARKRSRATFCTTTPSLEHRLCPATANTFLTTPKRISLASLCIRPTDTRSKVGRVPTIVIAKPCYQNLRLTVLCVIIILVAIGCEPGAQDWRNWMYSTALSFCSPSMTMRQTSVCALFSSSQTVDRIIYPE